MLNARIHSTLMTFGRPCPVSDLFGFAGRNMLAALDVPDPWRCTVDASLLLIDDPIYSERHQRNKRRLGKQRGAKVDAARRLTEALCPSTQLLLREAPLFVWPSDGPFELRPRQPASHVTWSPHR